MRKIIIKITSKQLKELCAFPLVNFAPYIVDVAASVIDSEVSVTCHMLVSPVTC